MCWTGAFSEETDHLVAITTCIHLHSYSRRRRHAVQSCSSCPAGRCCAVAAVRLYRICALPELRDSRSDKNHQNILTCHWDIRPVAAAAPALQSANYATLREIEGRLKSIRNIEKITKTMKIVASTKLTRAQRAMAESRSYGQTSNTVFEEAETAAVEGEGKKTLLVVCSSDKGLCGGIHSGLTRATRKLMNQNPGEYDIVVVGEKCKAQLSRSSPKSLVLSFAGIGKDVPTFADAQAIADQISVLGNEYSSIKILYNKFLNAQSYEATVVEAFSEEAIRASRRSFYIRGLGLHEHFLT